MVNDVSDFVGDCVSMITASIRIASEIKEHFIHHRHERVECNTYIPLNHQVMSILVRTLAFVELNVCC